MNAPVFPNNLTARSMFFFYYYFYVLYCGAQIKILNRTSYALVLIF